MTNPILPEGFTVPTDLRAFLGRAIVDHDGTDYPGILDVAKTLAAILAVEKFQPREIRLFSARFIVALEGYSDEFHNNVEYMIDTLSNVDLKPYWSMR